MPNMLRRTLGSIFILLVVLAVAGGSPRDIGLPDAQAQNNVQGQRPAAPGTIQVRVRLVPVDVVVTDRLDRPVTDLKKEEFRIFENGREQEIRHFTMQTFAAAAAEPAQQQNPPEAHPPEIVPQTARTFLILMGRGRHYRFKNMENLVRWVRTALLPSDRLAVFAYNRATDFTTDHGRVARVLEAYKGVYEKIEAELESRSTGLSAIYGSKKIPSSVQADIDRIFADSAELQSRQVPADTSETTQAKRDRAKAGQILTHQLAVQGAATVSDPGESLAATPNELAAMDMATGLIPLNEWAALNTGTTQDMKNIFTCIEYLRYLEGEKHLLFFTEEGLFFPFGNVDNDETIAQVANNARVAIDTFQTGGIRLDLGISKGPVNLANNRMSDPGRENALASLGTISQLTGGRSSIYDNLGTALARVDAISRAQYLLAYYPKDENWSGEYRQIEVKVTRPGLKVSYRHGYFARDTFRPSDQQEFLAYSRITAAGGYEAEIADIPFKIETSTAVGKKQVNVNLQIDAASLGFRSAGGRRLGKLRIAIFYADGKRNYLGEDWKNVDLKLLEDTYQRFLQSGIPISIPVPLQAPNQILKIVIYDTESDRVGSKLVKVRGPDGK
jgi:VWFA-related protein